ncbi:hypothetical protein GWC77_04840 [Paraburkholderia sp. NMBU_R16]|uniref:hypothetical protein n=1 Tax=Paraburkholderia sp. NMBU_R16 TaxID=2698676 RepID=UPI00156794A8|nr:hypothetical protein [Paraburkholderia sp. NMBU_R16]NRO95263.1 hypothetical protein [Paraburkholderia sp. NMBU_R16]
MKTGLEGNSASGNVSTTHGDSPRRPEKSLGVATARNSGGDLLSNLRTVSAPHDVARFGTSGGGSRGVALLEPRAQPQGAIAPPGKGVSLFNLSPPAELARRRLNHPELPPDATRGDASEDSLSDAEKVVQEEEKLLNTGMNFELGTQLLQMLRTQNELVTDFTKDLPGRAREFISN